MVQDDLIKSKVCETLITAASTFREDKKKAYRNAILSEKDPKAKWVLETILDNAEVAEKSRSPLCDDTGIPHLFLELGNNRNISSSLIRAIYDGVAEGLRELPGRPMAVKGDDLKRLDQSGGLDEDPGALIASSVKVETIDSPETRLYVLMQGGGPEIRAKTYRVFHRHKLSTIINEVVTWAIEGAAQLGCTPCVPAIGIGRSHYEAASLMIEAMAKGDFNVQSDLERGITEHINQSNIGPLGLSGRNTALATFIRVGPQRASGVRIVCLRLGCCFEPRVASVLL